MARVSLLRFDLAMIWVFDFYRHWIEPKAAPEIARALFLFFLQHLLKHLIVWHKRIGGQPQKVKFAFRLPVDLDQKIDERPRKTCQE